ncbi:MAG TPA: hypothetical protein VIB79_10735 [Candidatus Binatia bacterium]
MFIETYYDDRATVPGSTTCEPVIPYPELSGEELTAWRKYLPVKTHVENLQLRFNGAPVPHAVIAEIQRIKNSPQLFDRVEIWSRIDDPMAVGVIGEAKPRYFSIARWGDAELTLAEVKRKLQVEKWMFLLAWTAGVAVYLAAVFYMVLTKAG